MSAATDDPALIHHGNPFGDAFLWVWHYFGYFAGGALALFAAAAIVSMVVGLFWWFGSLGGHYVAGEGQGGRTED